MNNKNCEYCGMGLTVDSEGNTIADYDIPPTPFRQLLDEFLELWGASHRELGRREGLEEAANECERMEGWRDWRDDPDGAELQSWTDAAHAAVVLGSRIRALAEEREG